MIQTLRRIFLVLVVVNAWFLLGIVVCDYLFGNLLGLFSSSIYTQAWAILLLVALSFSPPLKATQQNIKQWYSTTGVGIYLFESLGKYQMIAARILHSLYINLYLLADVIFCIGAPLLVISATAGWWLLEEVTYAALLGYCCLISVIVFSGFYSNLMRLLSLGYFFGYWLLSEDMLLYPFAAPALVQKNTAIMLSGSASSWLPVVGLVLIVYLLARKDSAAIDVTVERKADIADSRGFLPALSKLFSKPLNRELFGSYLSLFCLLMAAPLGIFLLNSIIAYLNPHVLFAGFAIWILDRLWQSDVASEPALSRDLRYFVTLIWKH